MCVKPWCSEYGTYDLGRWFPLLCVTEPEGLATALSILNALCQKGQTDSNYVIGIYELKFNCLQLICT
jgi:hypothetical protein